MKYEVRRKERQIGRDEAVEILDAAEFAVISMCGADRRPYGIPINFARDGERLVFHCAPEGRKLDCIRFQPRVSLCVVGRTEIQPGKFTTAYESVMIDGIAEIIDDERRKIDDLILICRKYDPENLDIAPDFIEKSLHRTVVFEIVIESMTAKAKRLHP